MMVTVEKRKGMLNCKIPMSHSFSHIIPRAPANVLMRKSSNIFG
jgi:hypothetical protein